MIHERASQRDTLLLSPGQFVWVSAIHAFQTGQLQHVLNAPFAFVTSAETTFASSNLRIDVSRQFFTCPACSIYD